MRTVNRISFWLVHLVLLLTVSCREEVVEVQLPSADEAIEPGGELESLLIRTALLDGSDDNILDNASCLSINLPVNIRLDGASRFLSTQQDILELEQVFENTLRRRDAIELVYPIDVTSSTYEVIRVQNFQELNQLSKGCQERGQDDDIECVDVVYPVTFSIYDQTNQLTSQISISNDKALFRLLSRRGSDTLLSLNYPVQLNDKDGLVRNVSGNAELTNTLKQGEQGCEEEDLPFYPERPYLQLAPVSIDLTDAPFPIDLLESAWLTISEIQLKTQEDADTTAFFTYKTSGKEIDISQLTNGSTENLIDQEIPAGIYEFINLKIEDARVILTDGQEFDLQVPSGRVKVVKEGGIDLTSLLEENLLLDIDLSRSFVIQGNPDTPAGIRGILFKPVIKLSDGDETGTISGMVRGQVENEPLADVQITVFAADTVNTTSFTNEEGLFKILGLIAGEYELLVEKEDYASRTIDGVEIEVGENTNVDILINRL